jgi:hypothetical protein
MIDAARNSPPFHPGGDLQLQPRAIQTKLESPGPSPSITDTTPNTDLRHEGPSSAKLTLSKQPSFNLKSARSQRS